MASKLRSKHILTLINNNSGITNNTDQQSLRNENNTFNTVTGMNMKQVSTSRSSSPLPPGAESLLCDQKMQEVWNDVLLAESGDDKIQKESFLTSSVVTQQEESLTVAIATNSSIPCPVTSFIQPDPFVTSLSTINCVSEKNCNHCDVIREDVYLPTDVMTPVSVPHCPVSISSLHHNIDSPSPLTPIFNDLSRHSSPVTHISEEQCKSSTTPINQLTPVPSPINRHSKCNDPFCCQHESDEFECLSVNTLYTVSNEPSPAPLIRNRGKKRPRNYEQWGDVKRKKLKNAGKMYCTKKGQTVGEKLMGPPCDCRFKCAARISISERREIFTKFWELGDREKQWLHIANYTEKHEKCRTFRRELKHNRQFTYKYYLPKKETEYATHQKISVCKIMFLNTYGITERMTRTAWQKYDGTTSVTQDMRGRHNKHKKVINAEMTASVCAHVNAFVPVESHYCRKSSTRLYLDGSLSIARMFNMYKEWPDLEKYLNKVSTLRQYRDIVNRHFNLAFHIPKKDTCDQCHIFKNNENPSEVLKASYEEHQSNKTIARELKKQDKIAASQSNGTIISATFDFQKVLSCPHGQISVLYYKRKLSCYNFTIYNMANKEGFCYVWDESIAKRGANEVASCLYDYLKDFSKKGVKEYRFWSDNCDGQNKNRILFAMYTHAAKELGVTINHRFLEKGHTQNEGDSVHSVIERAGDHKLIYTPEEWKLLIRWAKLDNPYEVRDITKDQVYDFKDVLKNKNWTKNTRNEKIAWTKIKEVMIVGTQPYKILYKYSLADEYKTLIIRKETRNQTEIQLKNAYFGPMAISNDKFKDLLKLCETGIIPTKYHDYFNTLPHSNTAVHEDDSDSE